MNRINVAEQDTKTNNVYGSSFVKRIRGADQATSSNILLKNSSNESIVNLINNKNLNGTNKTGFSTIPSKPVFSSVGVKKSPYFPVKDLKYRNPCNGIGSPVPLKGSKGITSTITSKKNPLTPNKIVSTKFQALQNTNPGSKLTPKAILVRKAISSNELRNSNKRNANGAESKDEKVSGSRSIDSLIQIEICDDLEKKNEVLIKKISELEDKLKESNKTLTETKIELESFKNREQLYGAVDSTISPKENNLVVVEPENLQSFQTTDLTSKSQLKEIKTRFDQVEKKYADLLRDSLLRSSEQKKQELELDHWKEKYGVLKGLFQEYKEKMERCEQYEKDMFLVVQAANDYQNNAQIEVQKYEAENLSLNEQISVLKAKLKIFEDMSTGDGAQVLLSDNKSNKLANSVVIQVEQTKTTVVPVLEHNSLLYCDNKTNLDTEKSKLKPAVDINSVSLGLCPTLVSTNLIESESSLWKHIERDIRNRQQEGTIHDEDPLVTFAKVSGGSKRNALLLWCQSRTHHYEQVDITNFSTSWRDGMALCALLHSYLPEQIPYETLTPENNRENFRIALKAAESLSIPEILNVEDIISSERPSWENVMNYVKELHLKFVKGDKKSTQTHL